MFEEKLISEILSRKCVWDKKDVTYRNKLMKAKAWNEVAAAVHHSEEDCRKRWKSLRDKFVAEFHCMKQPSGSAAVNSVKWPYFEQMMFLKDQITPRRTVSNVVLEEPAQPADQYGVDSAMMSPPSTSGSCMQSTHHVGSTETSFRGSGSGNTPKSKKPKLEEDITSLITKMGDFVETRASGANVDPMLLVMQDYINRLEEEDRIHYKFELLQTAHTKFLEYKNKQK